MPIRRYKKQKDDFSHPFLFALQGDLNSAFITARNIYLSAVERKQIAKFQMFVCITPAS